MHREPHPLSCISQLTLLRLNSSICREQFHHVHTFHVPLAAMASSSEEALDAQWVQAVVRKLRKKLRQIERLERLDRELSDEELDKVWLGITRAHVTHYLRDEGGRKI